MKYKFDSGINCGNSQSFASDDVPLNSELKLLDIYFSDLLVFPIPLIKLGGLGGRETERRLETVLLPMPGPDAKCSPAGLISTNLHPDMINK